MPWRGAWRTNAEPYLKLVAVLHRDSS
jgi:hypothetical protein